MLAAVSPGLLFALSALSALLHAASPAKAGEALVAVAANFTETMGRLEIAFERESGHRLTIATGSTGKLYAQIVHGAPFDVLLAADRERPRLLEERELAVGGSRRTYATGRLALWSAGPSVSGPAEAELLRRGSFRTLAIANPELAPYGSAALEVLRSLDAYQHVRSRIVTAENVGQVHAMVATGNAELGLVALSQLLASGDTRAHEYWLVPSDMHTPIRQDAVLLAHAADNAAARAFLEFLHGDAARATIGRAGYSVD